MSDKKQPLDLSSLDLVAKSDAGFRLELVHPASQDALGVFVTVAGTDSKRYADLQREVADKRLNKRGPKRNDFAFYEEEARRVVAGCVMGWDGVVVDGEELPYTEANALALLERFPWIREQVQTAMGDRGNYLQD